MMESFSKKINRNHELESTIWDVWQCPKYTSADYQHFTNLDVLLLLQHMNCVLKHLKHISWFSLDTLCISKIQCVLHSSVCVLHNLYYKLSKIHLKLILIFQLAFWRLFLPFGHIPLPKQFYLKGKGEKQVTQPCFDPNTSVIFRTAFPKNTYGWLLLWRRYISIIKSLIVKFRSLKW